MIAITSQSISTQPPGTGVYVYGLDSDYLAFKDIAYLPIDSFERIAINSTSSFWFSGSHEPAGTSFALAARVFRRKELCRVLNMSEVQFINWYLRFYSISCLLITYLII